MKSRRGARTGANAAGGGPEKPSTPSALGATSGTLRLGKQCVPLRHAFAVQEEEPLAAGTRERLVVLLSDAPLPAELRQADGNWRRWTAQQAAADALHGLILTVDPATQAWTGGQLLTRDGLLHYSEEVSDPAEGHLQFTVSGKPGTEIAATVATTESLPTMDDAVRWTAEARFRCAVLARPAVSAELTGKAALASPQFQAVQTFLAACRKQDADAILASVEPASREAMAGMLAANRAEALAMFAGMAAESAKMKLGRVVVRGTTAEVELLGPVGSPAGQTLRVALAGGAWKLAQ